MHERSSSVPTASLVFTCAGWSMPSCFRDFRSWPSPSLFGKASGPHRLAANAMWPLSRRMMMRMHDITPDAAAESRSILESELDWLDSTLADSRRYLSGDRFSRADITVASLLAFFARTPGNADISRDV